MRSSKVVSHIIYTVIILFVLYVTLLVFRSGHDTLGFVMLILLALGAFVYAWKGAYAYRYLFPSLMAFGVFVILPLIYTIYIAFTNYSAVNFLTYSGVQESFLREMQADVDQAYSFNLYPGTGGEEYQVLLTPPPPEPADGTNTVRPTYLSEPFSLAENAPIEVSARPVDEAGGTPRGSALTMRDMIKVRDPLKNLTVILPDATRVTMISLRNFAPNVKVWAYNEAQNSFSNLLNGQVVHADMDAGFFVNEAGEKVGPGFRTRIGWGNFMRIIKDEAVRGPFITVFIWTILFALFSVVLTFIVGFLLAVLLEWKAIRGRKVWRSLVILPYAVPAFISILIFKGLFNPQFGEINMILGRLFFGFTPEWTTNPYWARAMVLIVNLWLGYPYMMILCTGILQSVPSDIYEASAIDGGTPKSDLFKMTLPLILPPLKPLLIASFAFNFNNFLLVQLLTNGAPQIVGAATSVGYTDILVTYTFNLAFRDAGANYGFASAIATIIFIIVSVLSYVNLKMATRGDEVRV
ncbi:MAG: maltose ABC transporter permease MalF [Spartobacteria bacterium]|nr:maltose ABC transporter permease MalF [Spartobacteria bacterium]